MHIQLTFVDILTFTSSCNKTVLTCTFEGTWSIWTLKSFSSTVTNIIMIWYEKHFILQTKTYRFVSTDWFLNNDLSNAIMKLNLTIAWLDKIKWVLPIKRWNGFYNAIWFDFNYNLHLNLNKLNTFCNTQVEQTRSLVTASKVTRSPYWIFCWQYIFSWKMSSG